MDPPTLSQTVTVLRRVPTGARGPYGGEQLTEQAVETVAEIQRRPFHSEREGGGELTETVDHGIFGPDEQIAAGDAIVGPDGLEYEVIGTPDLVRDPWDGGVVHHVEVQLRRTAGPETGS